MSQHERALHTLADVMEELRVRVVAVDFLWHACLCLVNVAVNLLFYLLFYLMI